MGSAPSKKKRDLYTPEERAAMSRIRAADTARASAARVAAAEKAKLEKLTRHLEARDAKRAAKQGGKSAGLLDPHALHFMVAALPQFTHHGARRRGAGGAGSGSRRSSVASMCMTGPLCLPLASHARTVIFLSNTPGGTMMPRSPLLRMT